MLPSPGPVPPRCPASQAHGERGHLLWQSWGSACLCAGGFHASWPPKTPRHGQRYPQAGQEGQADGCVFWRMLTKVWETEALSAPHAPGLYSAHLALAPGSIHPPVRTDEIPLVSLISLLNAALHKPRALCAVSSDSADVYSPGTKSGLRRHLLRLRVSAFHPQGMPKPLAPGCLSTSLPGTRRHPRAYQEF